MTIIKHSLTIGLLSAFFFSTLNGFAAKNENPIVKEITPFTQKYIQTPKEMKFIDANTYVQLSDDGRTIDSYELQSGKKVETLFDVARTREAQIGPIDGFIISDDHKKFIVWTDTKPVYRRSFTAKYYVYDTHSRILLPLSKTYDRVQCPVFSPDSRMIAFVYDNNIYLKKLDYNTELAVTNDGKAGCIINGATDWTYEEEFTTTSLMAFSPDNSLLCYIKSNETDVPTYTLPIYGGVCDKNEQYEYYPGVMSFKYPVAGQPNSQVSLHAYNISNRNNTSISLPDKTIEYIPRMDFTQDNNLLVTTLNREQNRMEIYSVNPKTTISTSIFVEKSDAWILPSMYEDMTLMKDGFIIQSPRSGWNQLYKYAYNGTLSKTITNGQYDVTAFYGCDNLGNYYYQAAYPTPIDRTVCRTDAKGVMAVISEKEGTSEATFSPDCQNYVLTYSNVSTPPVTNLYNSKGTLVREIINNSDATNRYKNQSVKEFIKVPGDNGLEFNAYIIKPANFNPSQKYPVVMYQYSGPGSQTVLNSWNMTWENYFASKGIVVFCLDGRGTGGRGTEFMFPVYRKLGYYETIDQLAGAQWLKKQTWVDGSKIGMTGWSYGGYETLMCLQADGNPFVAGVAIAPVTDWRFYDTVYAERYMLTPQQNHDGYQASAPLNFTDKMQSNLLLMLGTADDNVHPANTFEYAAALQYDGALFDMMVFPNKNHSIYGCNARAVVFGNMFRYFNNIFNKK